MTPTSLPSPPKKTVPITRTLGLFLLLPPFWPGVLNPNLSHLGTALLASLLVLGVESQLTSLLRPPTWVKWCFLPALATAPLFVHLSFPDPVSVLIPLTALAWVLNRTDLPSPPRWAQVLPLSFLAWALLTRDSLTPDFRFPPLPSTTFVWMGIAVVLPLGIATQKRLRPVARGLFLAEVLAVFLAASLLPPTLQTVTGFKEVGEPERDFFSLSPLPGFQTVTGIRKETWMPEEFRNFNDPVTAIRILDHLTQQLQPGRLETVSGGLDPDQALFLLQQTGFLQKDRYGFFVPAEVFSTTELPGDISPDFLPVVQNLARHASLDLSDTALLTSLVTSVATDPTPSAFRPMMLRLRGLNLVDTLPGNSSAFRCTPQARHQMSNGLFPRQLLFAAAHTSRDVPSRIHHADYAPGWTLSFETTRSELMELMDAGILAVDESPAWQFDAFRYLHPEWTSLLLKGLPPLLGLLLMFRFGDLTRPQRIRFGFFAAGIFLVSAVSGLPGQDTPLVYQAVWCTVWLPISSLFFGLAIR